MEGDTFDILRVLSPDGREVLAAEKSLLSELISWIQSWNGDQVRIKQLSGLRDQIEELFLLVIVGEVKAGKSSFINALLRADLCAVGPIPLTDKINILRYGRTPMTKIVEEFVIEISHPIDALKSVNVVDTPGTNSIIRRHEQITANFVPRSDLVLFLTSIDRPITESERKLLAQVVQEWRKKVIFVLTKCDMQPEKERQEVLAFIKEQILEHFRFEPTIFPVSSRLVKEGRASGNDQKIDDSGFPAIEDYIFTALSEGEKVRLKLLSPLETAGQVVEGFITEVDIALKAMRAEYRLVEEVVAELEVWKRDLVEKVPAFLLQVSEEVNRFESRAVDFLMDVVTVSNIRMLMDAEAFRTRFMSEVGTNFEKAINRVSQGAVDWLMKQSMQVWTRTLAHVTERLDRAKIEGQTIGKIDREYEYNRDDLVKSVVGRMESEIETFDQRNKVNRMVAETTGSAYQMIGMSIVGIGGTVLAFMVGGAATGVGALVAGLGLIAFGSWLIPRKRELLIRRFRGQCDELRGTLQKQMEQVFAAQIADVIDKTKEVLEPLNRFFRSRIELNESHRAQLGKYHERVGALGDRLNAIYPADESEPTSSSQPTVRKGPVAPGSKPHATPAPAAPVVPPLPPASH